MNRYLEIKIMEAPTYYIVQIVNQSHRCEEFYDLNQYNRDRFKSTEGFELLSCSYPEVRVDEYKLFLMGDDLDRDRDSLFIYDKKDRDVKKYIRLLINAVDEYNYGMCEFNRRISITKTKRR